MEYMDKGSLDGIYKKIGAIDIDIVAQVALSVLEGLTYLYDVHRIIHRGQFNFYKHPLPSSFTMIRDLIIPSLLATRHQTLEYPLQFKGRN